MYTVFIDAIRYMWHVFNVYTVQIYTILRSYYLISHSSVNFITKSEKVALTSPLSKCENLLSQCSPQILFQTPDQEDSDIVERERQKCSFIGPVFTFKDSCLPGISSR